MTIIFNTKLGEITGVTSSSKIQITVFSPCLHVHLGYIGHLWDSPPGATVNPLTFEWTCQCCNLMLTAWSKLYNMIMNPLLFNRLTLLIMQILYISIYIHTTCSPHLLLHLHYQQTLSLPPAQWPWGIGFYQNQWSLKWHVCQMLRHIIYSSIHLPFAMFFLRIFKLKPCDIGWNFHTVKISAWLFSFALGSSVGGSLGWWGVWRINPLTIHGSYGTFTSLMIEYDWM